MTDFNTLIHGNIARGLREWKLMEDLPNVAQESPLPSRGGMNCDSFYRIHMVR